MIGLLFVGVVLLSVGAIGYAIYQSSRPPEGSVGEFLRRPRPVGKRIAVIFGASTIHGDYAQVMRSLATERHLGYLPLHERMTAELKAHPGGSAWNKNLAIVRARCSSGTCCDARSTSSRSAAVTRSTRTACT